MALGVETTTSTTGLAVSSLTFAHTITLANKLMVTVGIGDSTGITVSGVTYNSQSLTFVGAVTDGNPWCRVEIWEKHNPSVTTANVVVTFSGSPTQGAAGATGIIDAATALGTASTNTTTSTNPTVTVVDSASGDIVVSVATLDGQAATTTEAGTLLWEIEDLGSDIDVNAQHQTASGASTVCSWTNSTNANWAAIGVAVKTSALTPNVQIPIASLWPILVAC